MDEAGTQPISEVQGRLCVWRVFRISPDFADLPRGADGMREFVTPFADAGSLAVVIGNVPEQVRRSLVEVRARANYLLNDGIGGAYRGMSDEGREAILAGLEVTAAEEIAAFEPGCYVTLEFSRPRRISVRATMRYLYGTGEGQLEAGDFEEFEKQAGPILDAAAAWLLPALGRRLQLGARVFGDARAYLLVPGKAAIKCQE